LRAKLALRFASTLGTRAVDTRHSSCREDDLSIEAVAATATGERGLRADVAAPQVSTHLLDI
jgi:hypothetical protein